MRVMRVLDLEGATVTIDAMGCQTAIAAQIVAQGAAYVLALKKNQPTLCRDVQELFDDALRRPIGHTALDLAKTEDQRHGRVEHRCCWVLPAAPGPPSPELVEATAWVPMWKTVLPTVMKPMVPSTRTAAAAPPAHSSQGRLAVRTWIPRIVRSMTAGRFDVSSSWWSFSLWERKKTCEWKAHARMSR